MVYSRPLVASCLLFVGTTTLLALSGQSSIRNRHDGKRLFESETFGGNGRTCRTCHSAETGTVSPQDAQRRFELNPFDPLFVHDGSDDGQGTGVTRMLATATVLMEIPLPLNVRLADDPTARPVILARGIPTTLNTPALDPVLMLDGRHPTLELQAAGAIHAHAQATIEPTFEQLLRIKEFQLTDAFFSSPELRDFARGGDTPRLPKGRTASEKRGAHHWRRGRLPALRHGRRIQDPDPAWHHEDGAVLPRQLGEDAGGRGRALRAVLRDRDRRRPGVDAAGSGGHCGLHEAALTQFFRLACTHALARAPIGARVPIGASRVHSITARRSRRCGTATPAGRAR
jgi:hypothetical protein